MKYTFIKNRAKESATKDRGSFTDYFKNQYVPTLLKHFYREVEHAETRQARIEIDPLCYALVIRVANLLTKNPPRFLDKQGNELVNIRDDWIANDYDSIFREVIISTRTHGFAVTEKLSKPFAGKNYLVHDLANGIIRVNLDDRWNISSYTIRPIMENVERLSSYAIPRQRDLLAKNALHFAIGRKGKYCQYGLSSLKPVWAQVVRANEILESMCLYDSRIGHGWLVCKVDPELYQGEETMLKTAVSKMNDRRILVLKQTKDRPADLDFIGSTVQVDFPRDLECVIGIIAAKTGFVTRWFTGSPRGFISSAKEDRYAVYATLKSIFAEYKDWIRAFLEKFKTDGELANNLISEIVWDDEGVLEEIKEQLEKGMDIKSQAFDTMARQTKYLANIEQMAEQ